MLCQSIYLYDLYIKVFKIYQIFIYHLKIKSKSYFTVAHKDQKLYTILSLIEFYGKDNKNGHFWTLGFHDSRISVHNDSRCYFEDKEPWINEIYFLLYELNENNYKF